MSKDTGGPAFPLNDERLPSFEGMTLRDWFAGQALNFVGAKLAETPEVFSLKNVAEAAYNIADDMIEQRSK